MNSIPQSVLRKFLFEFDDKPSAIPSLKRASVILAMQTGAIGALFLGPSRHFLRPENPPDSIWLALSLGPYELWDFLFPAACVFMLLAIGLEKYIIQAHAFSSIVWITFGIIWSVGGIMVAPSYLFAAGLLAIFVATHHITVMNLWKTEMEET